MTAYSAAATELGVYEKTLTANTVDTVTLNRVSNLIAITTDGTTSITYSTDGVTAPTVLGQAFSYIPAVAGTYYVRAPVTGGATVIKLISSGTPKYSVSAGFQQQTSG